MSARKRHAEGPSVFAERLLCGKCRRPVLKGLDGSVMATVRTVDAQPLSALGAAVMAAEGRYTASCKLEGDSSKRRRPALAPLWSWEREAGKAPDRDWLVEHRCASPPPAGVLTAPPGVPTGARAVRRPTLGAPPY